jgi:hypothetical protein
VTGKKRGRKVGSGRDLKRKADTDYSENKHTKKARARKDGMTDAQKDLEAARNRERTALSRRMKKTTDTDDFRALSEDQQAQFKTELTAKIRTIQYALIILWMTLY